MQKLLNIYLTKNRIAASVGISLLLHVMIFVSLASLLGGHIQSPHAPKVEKLEVHIQSQASTAITLPAPNPRQLTRNTPAPFKISQQTTKTLSTSKIEDVPMAPNKVEGVALPGAITSPWQGNSSSNIPAFQTRPPQHENTKNNYQLAMEFQARQREEYRAQVITLQLQQLLAKQLDVDPVPTGKCIVVEYDATPPRLSCNNSALYEVVYKEQKNIASLLRILQGLGRQYNGFSAESLSDKLQVHLTNE